MQADQKQKKVIRIFLNILQNYPPEQGVKRLKSIYDRLLFLQLKTFNKRFPEPINTNYTHLTEEDRIVILSTCHVLACADKISVDEVISKIKNSSIRKDIQNQIVPFSQIDATIEQLYKNHKNIDIKIIEMIKLYSYLIVILKHSTHIANTLFQGDKSGVSHDKKYKHDLRSIKRKTAKTVKANPDDEELQSTDNLFKVLNGVVGSNKSGNINASFFFTIIFNLLREYHNSKMSTAISLYPLVQLIYKEKNLPNAKSEDEINSFENYDDSRYDNYSDFMRKTVLTLVDEGNKKLEMFQKYKHDISNFLGSDDGT